ncbi:Death on curing protein, Doc toxin [uncultured Candidatus Thioglobus sp.]|nr:Death on curing protein, Doc toxin [uncultured Candidatus Thioglobus sp.]
MKVVWFAYAMLDLKLVKDCIAQDNSKAVQQMVESIKKSVFLLSQQPSSGRLGRVPNTRELIAHKTPFILPYRVRDNQIEILRVLHTSRQRPKNIL